ncbi:MAG TPA: DUF4145 domain-containing protein [Daejeonella sp.]|uniref:DUF4145 domain-containing protein n=1 Tax=Daejeonella sp. TaxID=2805397 RepID=UPI002EDBB7B1
MNSKYFPPKYLATSFNCPICGVYALQTWQPAMRSAQHGYYNVEYLKLVTCSHCHDISIWSHEKLIEPSGGNAQMPNEDLPDDIVTDYLEAKSIMNKSPRGAAALLRLAIQKLCKYLGESGDNINNDIASLVKKGLPVKVQRALDYVRVVGNNAVHPGTIDIQDTPEIVEHLFVLVNIIADVQISQPKQVDSLYSSLPAKKVSEIEKRDGIGKQ